MDITDREMLARTLMAEAGNQGYGGQIAAGSVIMNRVGGGGGYGNGLRGVILQPGQFSAWNSLTGYAGGEQGQDMPNIRPSAEVYKATDDLLSGRYTDPTGGALNYYNDKVSNPNWGEARAGGEWRRIGDHLFGTAGSAQAGGGGAMAALGRQSNTGGQRMAMQPTQRQGILGALGIQKQDRNAQGDTALPFYQRDDFKDTMGKLAVGFNSLTLRPDQNLAANVRANRQERQTDQTRNKTVEYLRANGRADLASMVERGMISAQDAAAQLLAKPKDNSTAAMQNYAEYQRILASAGPEAAKEFLAMSRSGTTINTGDVAGGNYLYGARAGLAPGYRLNIQTGEASVIPGGPVEAAEAAAAQAQAARDAVGSTTDETRNFIVGRDVDRLVDMIDADGIFDLPEAGVVGNRLAQFGLNQEAVTFRNTLDGLQGQIAFERLQQMRDASQSGGALGAINTQELNLLMGALGAIRQDTEPKVLRANLLDIKRIMTKIENDPIASSFYYGGGQGLPAGGGQGLPAGDGFSVTGQTD